MAEPAAAETTHHHPPHKLHITIDTIPYEVDYTVATAAQLLVLAGRDPAHYYLVQLVGKKERISYKGKPQERIELHEGSRFVTVYDGEVPVS